MDYQAFIQEQIAGIQQSVGAGRAINALSGGVDSSVVTALGHRALGDRLRTIFVDNALMREGEPARVVEMFTKMDIPVEIIDARSEFLEALSGLTDPEDKRNAITHTFYAKVFGQIVRQSGATHLLHGTILTDIEETVDGIKRQHNILSQLGIDPAKEYGYQVLEPLATLRKDGVREVARVLGFPARTRRADAVSRPRPGHADRGRSDCRASADGAGGDGHRGRGTGGHAGLPVPGRAAGGQGHGNPRWATRVRPDRRRPVPPQRGCPHRHLGRSALAEVAPDLPAHHVDSRREPLPVRYHAQAAGHD